MWKWGCKRTGNGRFPLCPQALLHLAQTKVRSVNIQGRWIKTSSEAHGFATGLQSDRSRFSPAELYLSFAVQHVAEPASVTELISAPFRQAPVNAV
jgi:hypothetical protein